MEKMKYIKNSRSVGAEEIAAWICRYCDIEGVEPTLESALTNSNTEGEKVSSLARIMVGPNSWPNPNQSDVILAEYYLLYLQAYFGEFDGFPPPEKFNSMYHLTNYRFILINWGSGEGGILSSFKRTLLNRAATSGDWCKDLVGEIRGLIRTGKTSTEKRQMMKALGSISNEARKAGNAHIYQGIDAALAYIQTRQRYW